VPYVEAPDESGRTSQNRRARRVSMLLPEKRAGVDIEVPDAAIRQVLDTG